MTDRSEVEAHPEVLDTLSTHKDWTESVLKQVNEYKKAHPKNAGTTEWELICTLGEMSKRCIKIDERLIEVTKLGINLLSEGLLTELDVLPLDVIAESYSETIQDRDQSDTDELEGSLREVLSILRTRLHNVAASTVEDEIQTAQALALGLIHRDLVDIKKLINEP